MLTCYVCVFSLRRESSDMILGDKPLLFQGGSVTVGRGGERKEGSPGVWIVMGQLAWAGLKEQ
jgi:hypothetical protein